MFLHVVLSVRIKAALWEGKGEEFRSQLAGGRKQTCNGPELVHSRLLRRLLGDSGEPGTVADKVRLPASQWEVLLSRAQ